MSDVETRNLLENVNVCRPVGASVSQNPLRVLFVKQSVRVEHAEPSGVVIAEIIENKDVTRFELVGGLHRLEHCSWNGGVSITQRSGYSSPGSCILGHAQRCRPVEVRSRLAGLGSTSNDRTLAR